MPTDQKFEERYKKLNAEQRKAVDEIDGPVMVVAGPGTGKTTILTLRIGNILRKTDTPPSGILALTFTDAGVKVMRGKLREIIGSRADEVRVHTFHGFAASVISEFDDHFPTLFRSTQITDIEAEVFVREILKDRKFSKLRPLGSPDFYVGKILGGISDCKKEAWTSEMISDFAKSEIERIKNDPEALSTRGANKGTLKAESLKRIEKCERTILFADFYRVYEEKKKTEKKIDFDDLIFELVVALKNDELLLRLLQEKFLYILVDEHQDTNDSQNLIVSQLANFFDTPNIFVVGDEKQAIYRFQGASVQNFLRFQNIWKDMKVIQLADNYRSHQAILDAVFEMIEKNYDENQYENLRVRLTSKSKEKQKPIDYILAGNSTSADSYLIGELKKVSKTEEKTAVIVRWNRDVQYVLDLCQRNGIPASAERGADIFSHPLGALYFNLLQYLIDPTYVEGLAETLGAGLWNLSFQKSVELIKKLRSGNLDDLLKEIPGLIDLQKELTCIGILDFLILVANLSGLTKKFEESPLSAEVWRAIISLSRDIAEQSNVSDPKVLIQNLLSYKKSAESKSIKIGVGSVSAPITIMTAHSSKGLEYDNVFLPFATEESWMRRARSMSFVFPREKDESDDVRDARRLFYVAITRAKKHVCILLSTENSLGKPLLPLRFIDELQKESVSQKNIPAEEEKIHGVKIADLKSGREKEMVEYAKRSLLEKGLSVTALNHFLNCTSEFLYKSVLKIPEAPNATSEKGIAMHKALALVWQKNGTEKNKSTESIQKTIEKSVREYFKTSLLPMFEKEVILDELLDSAPKVAVALKDYFNSAGEISVEKWVERNFHSKSEKIDLELHGQLDVIIDTGKKIQVFDYKTREAMSENAIKGQTQDADGNYFRQLVFYKMLLEGNSKFTGGIGNLTGKEIEPSLIFVKPDAKGRCPTITLPISETDIKNVKGEIEQLVASIFSGAFLTAICDDPDCKWCKMKKEFLV
jgi:DNA helicase-2/ATP-dependent DNA helicase PcrA